MFCHAFVPGTHNFVYLRVCVRVYVWVRERVIASLYICFARVCVCIIPYNDTCNPRITNMFLFWSWFRPVGKDTHDIHLDLSFTWQVLLLNYWSEQSMQWWGSSNGTRTKSPPDKNPPDIIPLDIIPRTTSPGQHPPHGQHPPMGNISPDNIPPWTISPMDNIPRTLSPMGNTARTTSPG